jgi:uncharacterized protein DUF4124
MRALAVAVLLAAAAPAWAQVLYKWTDKDGKVQYADKPPLRFGGEVTRIDVDVKADPDPNARPQAPAGSDIAARRRAVRTELATRVARSRDRLEAAKAALAAADAPLEDERQVVQQRVDLARPAPGPDSQSTGGMHGMGGMLGGADRSNCRVDVAADGRKVATCPTYVPSEDYYARVQKLEEAVRRAQDDVEAAEAAYRRGVD